MHSALKQYAVEFLSLCLSLHVIEVSMSVPEFNVNRTVEFDLLVVTDISAAVIV